MNLNTLSTQNAGQGLGTVGFVIKSLRHPDRKFRVEAKLANGKFAITRLDTGESYFVLGTEDRYDFGMTAARAADIRAEIVELEDQVATINDRLAVLNGEIGVTV